VNFTIHKEKLKDGLDKIKQSLSVGAVNPILEHFLFEVKNQILTVKTTDIQTSSIWQTTVESKDSFSFSLPGNTFISLVSSLENTNIEFNYNSGTQDVTLKCNKYTWDCSSGNIENFPKIDIPENVIEYDLPVNFSNFLKKVYFSIGGDNSKQDLNSLSFEIDKESNSLKLISTDRFRLSYLKLDFDPLDNLSLVIGKDYVNDIIKFEPNKIFYENDQNPKFVLFKKEIPSGTFITKIILNSIKYPDISAYINNSFEESEFSIKRSDLISSLKRNKISSDKSEKIASFEISKNKIILSGFGNSSKSKEELTVINKDDVDKSFNVKVDLLLDYLSQDESENISFKVIDKMCLVFDKKNYRHVLSIE
jgi:DNA polymerase-3 subunit beta